MHSAVLLPAGFRSLRPPFFWAGETATPPGCLCPGKAALGGAALGAGLGRTRVGGDASTLLCDGVLLVGGAGIWVTPPDGGVPGVGADAGAPVAGAVLGAGAVAAGAEGAAGAGALLVCAATALAAPKLAAIVKPNRIATARSCPDEATRALAHRSRDRNRSPGNAFSVQLNSGDAR